MRQIAPRRMNQSLTPRSCLRSVKFTVPAEPFGQVTPATAGTGHPQQRVQEQPVVRARAAFALRAARHTILDPFPLVIPKRITIHGRSPKVSLESDLRLRRNPKPLNRHHDLIRSKPFGRNQHDEIFGGICERQCQFRSRPSTFLQTDEHFHHRDFDFSSAARNRLQFDIFLITCRGHLSLRSAI